MLTKINRILIACIIASLLLFSSYILSAGQTTTSSLYLPIIDHNLSGWIGPYGGYIVAITIDPNNPQVLYAGSWGSGVFKSQDGGQSWQPANRGLDNLFINSLVIDPSQPSNLFAGTYKSQVYKSMDGGNTWVWSGVGMQDQAVVYAIAIDPLAPSILYAGTRGVSNNGNPPWNGVVYISGDAGQTWTPVLTNVGGEDTQDWVYSLAIDPIHHNNVYAATHEHGPYHSSNYGASWYSIHDGITDDSGRAIVISPDASDTTTLYYGVWHFDSIYKSSDGGNDWFLSNSGIPFTKVYNLAIDPIHTDTVYLATFTRGIMKTLDGGSTWEPAGLQDDLIYNLAVNPTSADNLFAGTAGDGLYHSLDGGASWQNANIGIENAMPTTVITSPTDPDRIYASVYGAGVFQSVNHGRTWSELNTGLTDKFVHALVQSPAQPELIFALTDTGGLFQNDLNSSTGWVSIGQALPLTLTPQPAFPVDHPFATHEMHEYFATPVEALESSLPANVNLLVMTFAPSDPRIAYLGTGGSGVYKTANGGASWQPAGLEGESIQSLAVDPADLDLVYAATATPGSLKLSLNGGDSWTDANLPVTFYSLATSATTPGILYAGTSSGIYRYQAGSWTQLGLADQVITAIATDPAQPDRIFAGTTSGAFYTTDNGHSWKLADRNLSGFIIQSINIDPTHPNWVYFCTKTHGIYLATIHF